MKKWIVQGTGAVGWGIFLGIAPLVEVLLIGLPAWIILFCWREQARSRRYGFWPGFVLRIGVIALVCATALALPTKYEDRTRVGPFASDTVLLADLCGELSANPPMEPDPETTRIVLPSSHPSLREAIASIEAQTGLRASAGRCGNGASLLGGAAPMGITWVPGPQ